MGVNVKTFLISTLLLLLLLASPSGLLAQQADPQSADNEKVGRALLRRAIAARGGATFTGIKTLVSKGVFTPFQKGMSQVPTPFENFILYPDRERVDFGRGKKKDRRIQVNQGRTGWVYDGDAQTLKDQTGQQIDDYIEGSEIDIDRILRADPDDPSRKIRFAGRGELRPGERADIIAIEIAPGRTVTIWLDRTTYLPISLTREKPVNGMLTRLEQRFFQYVSYDGTLFPNIVDTFEDGVQTSRVNYQLISPNRSIDEQVFAKPAGIKSIR